MTYKLGSVSLSSRHLHHRLKHHLVLFILTGFTHYHWAKREIKDLTMLSRNIFFHKNNYDLLWKLQVFEMFNEKRRLPLSVVTQPPFSPSGSNALRCSFMPPCLHLLYPHHIRTVTSAIPCDKILFIAPSSRKQKGNPYGTAVSPSWWNTPYFCPPQSPYPEMRTLSGISRILEWTEKTSVDLHSLFPTPMTPSFLTPYICKIWWSFNNKSM